MFIEIAATPNPATLKFLPGQRVMLTGARDFADGEQARVSPLAEALFSLSDVSRVLYGSDFVSVTIAPGIEWRDAKPNVLSILLDHFASEASLFAGSTSKSAVSAVDTEPGIADDPNDTEIIDQIKELIETRVRPAVAKDGGDIVYRGFNKGTVYLAMHGACSGCPSSTATLKNGIEQMLKHYVPEVVAVEAR